MATRKRATSASAQLRARLSSGEAIGAVWLCLGSPAAAEAMAHPGPDVAVFDLQHGLWTRTGLEAAMAGVAGKTIPLVRTLSDRPEDIAAALEAGAAGVIVPLVESAETARAVVAATRYPPDGIRSAGGVRPLLDFPATFASLQKDPPFVAVMIETAAGKDAVAEIAAVEGVDLVFVGTGDLALSLGLFPKIDDRHTQAVGEILAGARKAGCAAGAFSIDESVGAKWRALGAQFTVLACDSEVLRARTAETVAKFQDAPPPSLDG
ncbi:HpcH/HpaI aldolase family protein [Amorphus orientalis]|uniref:2-keto-3-deoxy-L-rhamnonate aldolase RhmA n=1 Tax=Amorphus orientalis TaxID=649198 RepID=A0AAE3VKS1_9HYPH|nr:aldolase/citrate lyase family protein [Amorphus orientalis]MDQ0313861.1 2-keto-3-deoxy-L-rhamnonate aldolase RhmA [Amorphus orientalis]